MNKATAGEQAKTVFNNGKEEENEMEYKFKVGQRIKAIDVEEWESMGYKNNTIYVVDRTLQDLTWVEGINFGIFTRRFEPLDDAPRPEFYVGQKVRCITKGACGGFTEKQVYTVAGFYMQGLGLEIVQDDLGSTTNGWNKDNFEPAEPRASQVGQDIYLSDQPIVQPCTCDFHTVVMVTGCACGAI